MILKHGDLAMGVRPEQPELARAIEVARAAHDDNLTDNWWRLAPALRVGISRHFREQEEIRLQRWLAGAEGSGLRIECTAFDREWNACGKLGGCEHDVYPTADGKRFMKRTHGVLHATWLEYLNRLVMANHLFPAAPFRLAGFGTDDEGRFFAVVSQPAVFPARRGATRKEVGVLMRGFGFESVRRDDYIHPGLGLVVEDLHDQNVLVGPGGHLFVIDPVIFVRLPRVRACHAIGL